jgi:DNA-directed RNA polymerase specialized sigma24 family protein
MNDAPVMQMKQTWPVRPLTRTRQSDGSPYHREADVEAQVRELSAEADKARARRLFGAEDADWDDARRPREETLVYFLREYARRGDDETAWKIAEALIDRTAAHIQRKLARWRLPAEDADDCARDLFAALCDAVFDTGASAEFWEVRFWVCLDRKLWNLVEKRQAVIDSELSPGDQDAQAEEDAADQIFVRLADTGPRPDALAEYKEALSLLNDNERTALYLIYIEGLPEESEDPDRLSAAKVLGVTGRSVRNYLRRAKEKLAAWQRGEEAAKKTPQRT